ncbi:MAG TPA: TetR/AcrR family transcriptional regulator C-terminal domain-containing protein [Miltoncostaeaceae bacterium]|nr:TetR/AcrR family transcriptional regulator C-terminal domain-containing protein [Miltoncostaeaceae bacterium]
MTSERPRLNRDAVLRAAQAIIDERGLDACTMRAVAADLGVEAMSLYWHVPNKEALLDGVIELMIAEMDAPGGGDADWEDALRTGARTFRRVVLRHRNALPLLASRPLPAYAAASRMTEDAIAALERGGFDRPTAIRAARTVSRYVMGFTFAERGPGQAPPPPSDSPALDDLLRSVADAGQEDLFEFGLETLLRGLRTWRGAA